MHAAMDFLEVLQLLVTEALLPMALYTFKMFWTWQHIKVPACYFLQELITWRWQMHTIAPLLRKSPFHNLVCITKEAQRGMGGSIISNLSHSTSCNYAELPFWHSHSFFSQIFCNFRWILRTPLAMETLEVLQRQLVAARISIPSLSKTLAQL